MKATTCFVLVLLTTFAISPVCARDIVLTEPLPQDETGLARTMPAIARDLLASDSGVDRSAENLFRLQLVAGRYAEASATIARLETIQREAGRPAVAYLGWALYANVLRLNPKTSSVFDRAFVRRADDALRRLDGIGAYQAFYAMETPLDFLDTQWRDALDKQKGRTSITVADANELVRKYLFTAAYHRFEPLVSSLANDDDKRRYIISQNIQVKTPDGATVCAFVTRPRTKERLPALLNFSIYADMPVKLDEARLAAAHGYAGVEGLTRGKLCSSDAIVPIEHDGADAARLIDWIAAQPWSDGRVGMYGGSYDGFAQWATVKNMPKALKAIMPSVTFSPGTDFPMEGNISHNQAYTWPFFTTLNKTVDSATYNDDEHWNRLFRKWYSGGQSYRMLDRIDGRANPFFERWLDHPSFDSYWQNVIPYGDEFARIDIPVLTTTGYYDSGQIGALSYFIQHYLHRPNAEHYLVIGPYDHRRGQLGTIGPLGNVQMTSLRGYTFDPAAQIDIPALRYAWFDYVFRGAPKPAILKDKVNYEVMGANVWKHAPTLDAMAGQKRRFYFGTARRGDLLALADAVGEDGAFVTQRVNFADRSDVDRFAPTGKFIDQPLDDWNIVDNAPNLANALEFVSAPFERPPEISGLFSGHLDFTMNKKDFDFDVTLFELTAKGEYFQLSYVWKRASFVADRSHRKLLVPERRAALDFTAGRLTSRQFQPGSRLVAVLSIVKEPGAQINYGTGKEVSDETIADAGTPLEIHWFADSYVDVPFANAVP